MSREVPGATAPQSLVDSRLIIEKLDVGPGDIVLVIVPQHWDGAALDTVANSLDWLIEEHDALAFVVPDSIQFKVVHADAVIVDVKESS